MNRREDAIQIYRAAVAAVQPDRLLPQYLRIENGMLRAGGQSFPLGPSNKLFVIGAGKASAAMAQSLEKILGDRIHSGLVVTKYGHAAKLEHIACLEAAHPVPDEQGLLGTERTLDLLGRALPGDFIICLLSGGASALWADAPGMITLDALRKTFRLLLESGANITEMNTVRKHLSAIKGGQLLRYAPGATWLNFIISDVPGDDPGVIASGPTQADETRFADVRDIMEKYRLEEKLPAPVRQYLADGLMGIVAETIKPGDPLLHQVHTHIIGSNRLALESALAEAKHLGYHASIVHDLLQGDAGDAARLLVQEARQYTGPLPACLLSGGETTVTVTGNGLGGRNQQMALHFLANLAEIGDEPELCFLAAGTDGTDGPTDAAGAMADKETLAESVRKKLNIAACLRDNDAYHFFRQTGSLLKTGPTFTNVMDISLTLVG